MTFFLNCRSLSSAATQNCDFVNLILTDHSVRRRQCVAVMGQYEAFHIQKFMRLPAESGKLNSNSPLRLVNRGAQPSGRKSTNPPKLEQTRQYWEMLQQYLANFQDSLQDLRQVAETVAVDNTVIVLVCNFGQSELLLNFLCSAKHRNLSTKQVLVFCTDTETYDLVTAMGVAAFYDTRNYGDMPKHAASRYADNTFMRMMMAKVYCVQQMVWLGYNVLFQDVDVIWYQHPLSHITHTETDTEPYDVYFQDDGNHAIYYGPYSANTGFYYVRNNDKTRHFFNALLLQGDLILGMRSHQVPLIAILQEHASMYGLRVKIWSRDGDEFPGGHAFHSRKPFMRDVISGARRPVVFHMSWTLNKGNKIKFYRQMGEWFLQDLCLQASADQIRNSSKNEQRFESKCCAAAPLFSCHYRDKPSVKPCRDSPSLDKDQKSWW
jgi:Nucleotide-diphospho-sugar transferase